MATTRSSVHVAFLRGINVGGKNRVKMVDLVRLFEDTGCRDVDTYIQSGNVVFEATATVLRRLPGRVRDALGVPVVIRSGRDVARTVTSNPFLERGVDASTLHVAFLDTRPSAASVRKLDPDRSPPDAFVVVGDVIYVCCPNGLGRSKLTTAYFDGILDTTATVRNWRTVTVLHEKLMGRGA